MVGTYRLVVGIELLQPDAPVHTMRMAALSGAPDSGGDNPTFADLSPVTISEILRDLTWLCAPPATKGP